MADDPLVELLEEEEARELAQGNGHQPASPVWERLREQRARLEEDRHIDLGVPGTGDQVGLRLGPIPGATQAALAKRQQASRSRERDFNLNADFVIAASQAVLVRDNPDLPWRVDEGSDGEPHTLSDLPALLGRPDIQNAREVIRYLFSWAPSPDLALTFFVAEYINWASASEVEVVEELAGESQAAQR